jgi:hypothetical protein
VSFLSDVMYDQNLFCFGGHSSTINIDLSEESRWGEHTEWLGHRKRYSHIQERGTI